MDRQYYLDLARRGLRMPIGTDLILRAHDDHEAIILNGRRLGEVLVEAAEQWKAPMAWPLMDLTLEKRALLERLDIPSADIDTYHFEEAPSDAMLAGFPAAAGRGRWPARSIANLGALAHVAARGELLPVGMSIGPFSLTTKLLADPITAVYLAGAGEGGDDEEVDRLERTLELATRLVLESIAAQARAGAKAIFIAEPAANKVYFSPNQIAAGSDVFGRYAMAPNRRIKRHLDKLGVDLLFHCCGELIDAMVRQFGSLDPAILSLGSSRSLSHDATLVTPRTVLYGNLPSKKFYSDDLISPEQVGEQSRTLLAEMRRADHPFILGSECDVLSVPGCEQQIRGKVARMLACD